jgi:hypothetical protein
MNVLIHQIENRTYEKTLLNQTNFDTALHEHIRNQAKLAVKPLGLAFSLPRFHWISSRRLPSCVREIAAAQSSR